MPGTGSAGPSGSVKPSRLSSPQKHLRGSLADEYEYVKPKSTSSSRIGSAVSVASTSRGSEKDAAGLITDLTRLKEITHDVRIPRPELPHRKAIEVDEDELGITDWEFPTELNEQDYDHIEYWKEQADIGHEEEEDEDLSDLQDIEDVFGDDVASVSSLGSNPDDDADKYDTDLEEDVESKSYSAD